MFYPRILQALLRVLLIIAYESRKVTVLECTSNAQQIHIPTPSILVQPPYVQKSEQAAKQSSLHETPKAPRTSIRLQECV